MLCCAVSSRSRRSGIERRWKSQWNRTEGVEKRWKDGSSLDQWWMVGYKRGESPLRSEEGVFPVCAPQAMIFPFASAAPDCWIGKEVTSGGGNSTSASASSNEPHQNGIVFAA